MTIQSFKRKKGTMYRYRFTLKGITVCSEMYEDKKLCQRAEAKAKAEILDNTYITTEKKTVTEMWNLYNEMRNVKAQSMLTRNSAFRQLKMFGLADMPFTKVTTLHLERFQKYLYANLAESTAYTYIVAIVGMFNWARKKRLISLNPAEPMEIHAPLQQEPQIFTLQEFMDRLNLYKEKHQELYAPMLLAGFFGLRISEICAVNIHDDFDFERKVLKVTKQYGYVGKGQTAAIKVTKTSNGVREVPIFPFVEPLIKEQILRVKHLQFSGQLKLNEDDQGIPFCPSQRGRRFTASSLGWLWKSHAIREGIPHLSMHKLRHTYATICRDAEISMDTIADLLGHSDTRITKKIYAHKTSKQIATAAAKLDNVFTANAQ